MGDTVAASGARAQAGAKILDLARTGNLWPNGHRFAFTIFDDPDGQSTKVGREVYSFLRDCGFRTTRGCWPSATVRAPSDTGENCSDPSHVRWLLELRQQGFELGLHNVTNHTSYRQETIEGLNRFRELFEADPLTMSNHFANDEAIYFGPARFTGVARLLYNVLTRGQNRNRFYGETEGHPLFWGDYCRERIRYVRNFVFTNINTLAECPFMPYRDPLRPFVQDWYASAEGSDASWFLRTVTNRAIDELEHQGGCCIIYTHFAKGFYRDGSLNAEFRQCMERLSRKNGWFVPVATLLDHLRAKQGGTHILAPWERRKLEYRWLLEKIRVGSH